MKEARAAVIILTYNSEKWIQACLESLLACDYKNKRLYVVDNGSEDKTKNILKKYSKKIKIIYNKKNLGWAKANNIAIKEARKKALDYLVLLNSDTIICDDKWLNKLVEFADKNPQYAVLGPYQRNYYDDEYNDWTNYILENGNRDVLHMWKGTKNSEREYEDDLVKDVFFVQGSAMLIRNSAFDNVGLFNEEYYIYYDEVDFCRKLRKAGFKAGLVKNAFIKHYGGGDTQKSPEQKLIFIKHFTESKIKYILMDADEKAAVKKDLLNKIIKLDLGIDEADLKKTKIIEGLVNLLVSLGGNNE